MADPKQAPQKSETEVLKARIAELEEQLNAVGKPNRATGEKVSGIFRVTAPCFRQGRLFRKGETIELKNEQVSKAMVRIDEKTPAAKPVAPPPPARRPNDKTVA